jgi:hypothetical protein
MGKAKLFSGGALNLSKCAWYTMFWDWKHGRPVFRPIQEGTDFPLTLHSQGEYVQIPTPIKRLPTTHASRIRGVYLSPNGNFSEQLQVLTAKSESFAIRLRSPRLIPRDIVTFHRTMYSPAMKYVLPALAINKEELASIQSSSLSAMLQKLGYSSKTPTAI